MNMVSMVLVVSSVTFSCVLVWIGALLKSKGALREKSSALECGLDPNKSSRVPFSLRFLLLTIVFLILDVELSMLLGGPLGVSFFYFTTMKSIIPLVLVLMLGLFYEWKHGSLNWK